MTRIPRAVLPFSGPLPYPAAHVLRGSEVERSFLGFTRAHAVGRAFLWARGEDAKDRDVQVAIWLPAMAASREAAKDTALGWADDLTGRRAVIYGAPMLTGSAVFIDELVRQAKARGAIGIDAVGFGSTLFDFLKQAGKRHGLRDICECEPVDV